MTSMPSCPPAQAPAMSACCWAVSASSVSVGTYGGLNSRMSTACARRARSGPARDAKIGSIGTYLGRFSSGSIIRSVFLTLFWTPVALELLHAYGLMSVAKYTGERSGGSRSA